MGEGGGSTRVGVKVIGLMLLERVALLRRQSRLVVYLLVYLLSYLLCYWPRSNWPYKRGDDKMQGAGGLMRRTMEASPRQSPHSRIPPHPRLQRR